MAYDRWTKKPNVPALIRAAAIGTLGMAPLACGDDTSGDTGNTTMDVHPTAGPCAHGPPEQCPESTGNLDGMDTMDATDTEATVGGDSTTMDQFPTVPCAHDPNAPGCGSTGPDSTGGTADGTTDGSGTDSGSDSGTGTTGGSGTGD